MVSLHVSGRASNSFITRAKWVLRNWVLLAFTLLVSETVVQFRAHPVHCQRVQTQLEEGSPDFSRPPSSFKSVFFLQIFTQKVLTTPLHKCILQLPSGYSHLFGPLLLANVFSALSKHLFPSSFHCSFQALRKVGAFLMSSSVSVE